SSGGLAAVKALGLSLKTRGLVQVSMNLTDFEQTGIDAVYQEVSRMAAQHGVEICENELIGMVPREALEQAAPRMLKMNHFDSSRVIETRIETVRGDLG